MLNKQRNSRLVESESFVRCGLRRKETFLGEEGEVWQRSGFRIIVKVMNTDVIYALDEPLALTSVLKRSMFSQNR
uniref:Uncharacterized protein n=1 Tax=Steinernema glaseri TaxID=37863 RepID=A0A1I7YGG4_9BILA